MAKLTSLVTAATLLAIGGVSTVAARQHVDMIDDNLRLDGAVRDQHAAAHRAFPCQVATKATASPPWKNMRPVAPMKVVGIWEMSTLATRRPL